MNANFNPSDFGFQETQSIETLWVRAKFDIARRLNPDRPSWYFFQGEGETRKPVALPQRLTGKLVGLLRKEVIRNGEPSDKLYAFLEISPERRVAIEVGFTTFIARSILKTAAIVNPEFFMAPVKLTCYKVDTKIPTMGVSIRDSEGDKIVQAWTKGDDWDSLYDLAHTNIRLANGMKVSPDADADADAGDGAFAGSAEAIAPAPVAAPVPVAAPAPVAAGNGNLDDIPF